MTVQIDDGQPGRVDPLTETKRVTRETYDHGRHWQLERLKWTRGGRDLEDPAEQAELVELRALYTAEGQAEAARPKSVEERQAYHDGFMKAWRGMPPGPADTLLGGPAAPPGLRLVVDNTTRTEPAAADVPDPPDDEEPVA